MDQSCQAYLALRSSSEATSTLSTNIAQKLYIIGSLGPKALNYESFDAKG